MAAILLMSLLKMGTCTVKVDIEFTCFLLWTVVPAVLLNCFSIL